MRFDALQGFKGLWRVDGVPDAVGDEGYLKLNFVLTPVIRNGEGYLPEAHKEPQVVISTPRCLNVLTIGSIWNGAERIEKPEVIRAHFEIDTSEAKDCVPSHSIRLGRKYSEGSLLEELFGSINMKSFLSTGSYKAVRIKNNYSFNWLIISPSEILRYYSGRSGLLLTSFLRNEENNLIDWQRKPEGCTPIISEKTSLNPRERKVLARALVDQSFKESLQLPFKRISATRLGNNTTGKFTPLTLYADFPFEGKTTLKVSGRIVKIADEHAIFVNEIFSCTYPFGFDSLKYEPYTKPAVGGAQKSPGKAVRHHASETEGEDDELDDDIEDTSADARIIRRDISDIDFFFLVADNITEERVGEHLYREGDYHTEKVNIGIPVSSSTIGDDSYGKEFQGSEGVDINTEPPIKMVRALEEFFIMIEEFRKSVYPYRWSVNPILIDPSATPSTPPLNFLPKPNIRATWHMVPDGTNRSRQFACIETKIASHRIQYAYILELELIKPNEGQCIAIVCRYDGEKMEYKDFRVLLRLLINLTHWPNLKKDAWKKPRYKKAAEDLATRVKIEKINHKTKNKPAAITIRIKELLGIP